MHDTVPPAPPPPKPRRWRALAVMLALVALMAALVAGAAAWIWRTTDGLAFVIAATDRLLPGRLHARNLSGSLAHGFAADELVYEDATVSVRITGLRAALDELRAGRSLAALSVGFSELLADRLAVRVRPPAVPPVAPPQSIALPFALRAERLAVGEFELHTGDDGARPLRLRQIAARVEAAKHGYAATGGLALGWQEAPLRAQFDATLGGATPFVLAGRGTLAGSVGAQPLQAAVKASGSLVDLRLQAEVVRAPSGAAPAAVEPRGTLVARIAAFEAIALRQLAADFEDIDPAAWIAGAPQALLSVQAQLQPRPGVPFTLEGPIAVRNRADGPIDRGRVPLRAGTARIALSAESLRLSDISAELARGHASGSFDFAFARADAWRARTQFRAVDPSALHSRLQRFSLDGQAEFAKEAAELVVRGQLRNRAATPLRANVELRASAQRVRIDSARLDLGRGQASFSGEVQLTAARALRLDGSVTDLDPSLLVAGLDGRLTGRFGVAGALAPQPAGTATFRIDDSRLLGRPLAGHGSATLAENRLDLDAQLAIRSATLSARGTLGAGGTLALALVAPQLGELGLPVSGRLVASATLAGELSAPSIDAQLDAAALSLGEHRIGTVQAVASYAGAADGRMTLLATAAGHRFRAMPALSLQSAVLRVEGRPSEHRIELRASNEELQPLELDFAGGWRVHETGAPASWRGELRHALAGSPFDLRLLQPAPLRTDLARWSLGPVELAAAGSRIEQLRVDVDDAYFSSSGRFSGLQPGALRGNGARIRPLAGGAPEHAPTTLRGHWQVRLGAQADGQLLVERSDGDIVAGTQAMGLTDLRLSAQLRANRLQAEARFAGTVAGRAQAQLAAEVERGDNGWRLAQQRPIAATAEVDMPSIAWINSLLTQAVRANVRIGGALRGHLRVLGTPAAPQADGRFEGEALRIAWIEQAIRLEGGRLLARVDGDRLLIDELRFPGPITVAPADRRPMRALARDAPAEPGFVAMTGALKLRDRSGVVQVQAVRMPVLQRPDRWAVATGGANIVFDPRQVQLNGALVANAGFVDFSRPDLPTLSADVRVLRATEPPVAREEAPLGINFDLGIDLGEAFYLRGAGLETRVEGQLRLRAQGRGAIHATGALEAREGTYEGFGQRLAIERGRVNFHGPLENPGLDVLALRRGLPVEVGVAVTRTAADPLVRLHSAEPMTEQEMLTWLVLGRPPAATEAGADRLALATAAAGLLAGTGEGYGTQFARRIGIDELTLRTGEIVGGATLLPRATVAGVTRATPATPAGEIVTIGKRLTEDLTLSFERAASGTETLVQIIYRVSDRVSLVARAGTENAFNLVYSIAFD